MRHRFTGREQKKDPSLPPGVYLHTNKVNKPSKAIEKLMGLYEQQLVRLNLKRNLGVVDKALYRFFGLFPYKEDPEDFSRLDIEYFRKERAARGRSEAEIEKDVDQLCGFFHYLIDFHGYNLANPASKRPDSFWKKRLQESLSPLCTAGNIQVNKEGSQS